jgi:hypothetical protein
MDHGIAALKISVADQYHAMRVDPFMLFVIEHLPHWVIPILASSAISLGSTASLSSTIGQIRYE